jgi:hypothetical protein
MLYIKWLIIGANEAIVGATALTHNLNYIVKYNSEVEEGKGLRKEFLSKASLL